MVSLAWSVSRLMPRKVRKSLIPLTPPVTPCWPMITMARIADSASVMIEKYTPPTRLRNAA